MSARRAAPSHPPSRAGARSLLMLALTRFYSTRAHIDAVLPYINGTSAISLRTIDWFVTNYARRHEVLLRPPGAAVGVAAANVYLNYRTQLKAYSKQQFDPFRRRDRISFYYAPDRMVETTIGQLNFFRWMVEHGVLSYVVQSAEAIERDMAQHASVGGGGAGAIEQKAPAEGEAGPPTARPLPIPRAAAAAPGPAPGSAAAAAAAAGAKKSRSKPASARGSRAFVRSPGIRRVQDTRLVSFA